MNLRCTATLLCQIQDFEVDISLTAFMINSHVTKILEYSANSVITYSAAHDADLSTFVAAFLGALARLYYAV